MEIIEGGLIKQEEKKKLEEKEYKKFLYNALFNCNKKEIVYYCIKYINVVNFKKSSDELNEILKVSDLIFDMLPCLTYREIFELFPNNNACFSNVNINTKIGENINEFLEYFDNEEFHNFKISRFRINEEIQRRILGFNVKSALIYCNNNEKKRKRNTIFTIIN